MVELTDAEQAMLDKLRTEKTLCMHDGYDLAIKVLTRNVVVDDAIKIIVKGEIHAIVDNYPGNVVEEDSRKFEVALPAFLLICYNSVFDTDGVESVTFFDEREPDEKRLYTYEIEVTEFEYRE